MPAGTHSDPLVPAKSPPRAKRGGPGSSLGAPQDYSSQTPCHWISPSLRRTCEAREGGMAEPCTWPQGEGTWVGTQAKAAPNWQASQTQIQQVRSKTKQNKTKKHNQIQKKTHTARQTQEMTPTGQRSPEAPARDAAQDPPGTGHHGPARDGSREGMGVKSLSVQLQRDSKEDVGTGRAFWSASGLAFFFVFF